MSAPPLTCRDAIDLMADYLEHALGDDVLAALERHLADCPACLAYLNTYKKTRDLTGQAGRVEMPPEMQARLRQILLEQLGRDPS
jgi:RNA polymerase sigma-70 factor (ECF subfamily)